MVRRSGDKTQRLQGIYCLPEAWTAFQQAIDVENSIRDQTQLRVSRSKVVNEFIRRYVENRLGPQPEIWPGAQE